MKPHEISADEPVPEIMSVRERVVQNIKESNPPEPGPEIGNIEVISRRQNAARALVVPRFVKLGYVWTAHEKQISPVNKSRTSFGHILPKALIAHAFHMPEHKEYCLMAGKHHLSRLGSCLFGEPDLSTVT